MYPPHLIEEVRNAADIVDVISDYVKLKKSGGYFIGLSPFKPERTPSFTVTPSKQIFKDFSTGKGGNVFTFLMEREGMSFTEAVRFLAKRYNVSLPEDESPDDSIQAKHREGIMHALRFGAAWFQDNLLHADAAETARKYISKRGLDENAIRKFGLGYALPGWRNLIDAAKSAGINEDYLFDAGLIRRNEDGRPFDYFRDRLIFPIFDASARVIGFGGRILENADGPKYLNSPETEAYHKSQVLYGLQLARNEFRKKELAMLVEGYMDVIALQKADILNVVATSGTALTQEQAKMILRYTSNLLIIYDADDAGQKAMIRALPICLQEGLNVKMLHLPDEEDPDSFVRKYGGEAFLNFAEKNAKDFVSFLIEKAHQKAKWEDPNDRKKVIDLIISNISLVRDPVMRDLLMNDLSQKTKIGTRAIQSQILVAERAARAQEIRQHQRDPQAADSGSQHLTTVSSNRAEAGPVIKRRPPYELELLRLMMEKGAKMTEFIGSHCNAEYFADPDLRLLFQEIINRWEAGKTLSPDELISLPHPYPSIAADILLERALPGERSLKLMRESGHELPSPLKFAKGALKVLRQHYFERKINEIEALLSDSSAYPQGSEPYNKLRTLELQVKKRLMGLKASSMDELFQDPVGMETDAMNENEQP